MSDERTSDDRVLAYLSGEMTPAQRRDFEQEMARDAALRASVSQWSALARARQLAHNDQDRPARFQALMRQAESSRAQAGVASGAAGTATSTSTSAPMAAPHGGTSIIGWLRRVLLGSGSPGLGLPLGWVTAAILAVAMILPAPRSDGPPLTRGAEATCPRLRVNLPDDLTAARLRETLTQYAVTLVSGPDADGYFIFSAKRASSLRDAASALGATASTALAAGACQAAGR